VDPVETKGLPWDIGHCMGVARSLMDHVAAASPGGRIGPDDATGRPASTPGQAISMATRLKHDNPETSRPGRETGWAYLQTLAAMCRSDGNPALSLLRERFSIALQADAINRAGYGALRLLMLADLFHQIQPREGTLHQVGRPCLQFIWGFDPDCAIICRAVLEAALDRRVAEGSAAPSPHQPGAHGLHLVECGTLQQDEGIPSAEALGLVRQVEQLAKKAVQGRLFGPEKALEAVRGTVTVLEELGGRKPQGAEATSLLPL
jgi:hypothetical protein